MKYIDMHCDTISALYKSQKDLYQNDLHIDITKMKKGECLLQNFAIFTDIRNEDSNFTKAVIDYYYKQLDINKEYIKPIYSYQDIIDNDKNNLISAMLTLEEGSVIDNDLDNLKYYYDKGVRMITLTWNYPNGIGYPNFDLHKQYDNPMKVINTKDGLTEFGIEFVKRCEQLGIMIDVSHLSDKGFYDVLENTSKPFVASHSNARSICDVARNLTDDMIIKLSKNGGVTGLNYCASFMNENNKTTMLEDMVKHCRYITNIGGIDVLGLGSDFDGISNGLEIGDASNMQMLYDALKPYYTNDELEKIFYKNVLRVYKENLK